MITKPYNRERAVEYARTWALRRNPFFIDFTGIGGNCTNFVSQAVLAGSCTMNYTPDFGWYYISPEERAPAWSSVEAFYSFITGQPDFADQNGGAGPYAREVPREEAMLGDVVQYANEEEDWYHTVMITAIEDGEIYVSAQSDDALDRAISTYPFASARFLHIEGVRVELSDDACFDILLRGGEDGTRDVP
ncbi:MAG: amidase domain-containing protein [Clostridia bacterium]|nr:amidase domain-containing protein [Clostridia bacterium]